MKTPVEQLRDLVRLVDEIPTKRGIHVIVTKKIDQLVEDILGA